MSRKNDPNLFIKDPLNWSETVGYFIARNQRQKAIDYLNEVIGGQDMPLFFDSEEIKSRQKLAWLYKIALLRSWERGMEALAWVCLQCELHPDDVSAQALKERLKRHILLEPGATRAAADGNNRLNPDMWAGVAGMFELKAILERDVILPLMEPEIYRRYKLDLPNGMLLYGPPGCGKTFIARHLAKLLDFHYIEVKPSDLGSIYVHGGQLKIGEVFKEAQQNKPCMVFFDELDALVPARDQAQHHYASEVNEFLVQLNEAWKRGIFVVGATNNLNKIDTAVRRPGRLDKKIFVGPPDYEARVELFKLYMKDRPQTAVSWIDLASKAESYTCAEIELIVTEAARIAFHTRRPIEEKDLLHVISSMPPAHSPEKLKEIRGFTR